jgi:hypothetical protein
MSALSRRWVETALLGAPLEDYAADAPRSKGEIMGTVLLIVLLVLLFGGGGGYYWRRL